MLVVPELDDPFLPLPDELLVNLRDSRPVIEALLDALPATYSSTSSNDSAMGPALQVKLQYNTAIYLLAFSIVGVLFGL
jgi:protein transport protein SEC24